MWRATCWATRSQPASTRASPATTQSYEVDDSGTIWINWDNGASSLIESGWWWPHADGPEASTQLYGKRGWGQLFPTRLEIPDREAESVATVDPGFAPVREEHCPQEMYDLQLAHFVNCIRADRTPNPGAAEGLVNMRIVDAALDSSRRGEVLRLD